MDQPFLQQFLKQRQATEVAKKPAVIPLTPVADGKPDGGIRHFARSKPTGKDVEKWFRAKASKLDRQAQEDEES